MRRLSREEAALWAQVAGTVKPMAGRSPPLPLAPIMVSAAPESMGNRSAAKATLPGKSAPQHHPAPKAPLRPLTAQTLDANWDRRLANGLVAPDFTLDLHGHNLTSAHARLDNGIGLALAQSARLVLLITGKPRPSDDHARRGERRGAIRAKFLDWLAQGSHASRIAAIRPAHPRHGGAGAVYVVLRRHR